MINVVIDAFTDNYFNDFEDDSGDGYQLLHQRDHISENAALDTLTTLAVRAK